ncbi:MAG: hypothetical protein KAG20_10835, partial [Cocleimonas sp.]|nr:hypothetical protein [Cocleimonas sp.]
TYSDYLLHQQRPKEVIQLLTTQPEEDQLLLRVAIATKQLGDSVVMKRLVTLLEQRFANAFAKNNHTHGREEALFLLEFKMKDKASKQRALKLAKKNWDSQKEPDDALIFLRAIRANQLIDQQKILIQWMKQHKLQDQRLTALLNK